MATHRTQRTQAANAATTASTSGKEATERVRRPGPRGWFGRGGGAMNAIEPAVEFRGTSTQVCGLWPFSTGAGTPMTGVPLGRHLQTAATVCCDPVSWFQRAKLIPNPSALVLGRPGLGKSTVARRWAVGLAGYGVLPMVLGDVKGEHIDMIRALGGQVNEIGRDRGALNVMDPGEATTAAARLTGAAREQLLSAARARRLTVLDGLLTIVRKSPPTDREQAILDRCLRVLDERHETVPVLADLLHVIQNPPQEVRDVALDRGDMTRYQQITDQLEASLIGLVSGGRFGQTFGRPTTEPIARDRPFLYDISSIDEGDKDMQAAALLACWSAGFGSIEVARALSDAGLEPQRNYFIVLDELWLALRAGRGMVDRVDALTRLNRQKGVGMVMLSHTVSDLLSLSHPEDVEKAQGFVERAGMVVCGGLPEHETQRLSGQLQFSNLERELVAGWQSPPSWDPVTDREAQPPGVGRFLIKAGGRPGVPVDVQLTATEQHIHDTNKAWHNHARVSERSSTVTEEVQA